MAFSFVTMQPRQVGLRSLHRFANFNQGAVVQLQFVTVLDALILSAVVVAHVVTGDIVYHDAFVEGVVSEKTILPALGFASHVIGVEAAEADHRCGVLGRGDVHTGGTSWGGHFGVDGEWSRQKQGP